MEIGFKPGRLSWSLSRRPEQARLWQNAVGGLWFVRTRTRERPAFVRRTNTRTKAERLCVVRVCPGPFEFRL